MSLKTVIFLLVFSFVSLASFLIVRLNQEFIFLDLLFKDGIKVKVGELIIGSLITGFLIFLVFECLYFYQKNKKRND